MFQRSSYSFLVLICIHLCFVQASFSQKPTVLKGIVVQEDGKGISKVNISLLGSKTGTTTNATGHFSLKVDLGTKPILHFSHIAFHDTTFVIEQYSGSIVLVLRKQVHTLNIVDIGARVPPTVVFGHKEMHVADVELIDDGLLLLTYTSEKRVKEHFRSNDVIYRHPRLVLTDRDQHIIHTEYLSGEIHRLQRDYLGRIFLIGREEVFLVGIDKKMRIELKSITMQQFRADIEPCVATLNDNIYFSNYDASYPEFSYYSFDSTDSNYFELCSIEDKPLMALFRSQYKYMSGRDKVEAMDIGFNSGVDPEVVAAYMTGFQNDLYYEPLYAPLFVQDEKVLIFDHYNNVLRKYGPCHEQLGEVEIKHHLRKPKRNWRKLLIQDGTTGIIYTVHEKGAKLQLFPIDLSTGELGAPFELYYKWAENLHVDNGEVYYIYRPFGSLQKKFLYKESIKLGANYECTNALF